MEDFYKIGGYNIGCVAYGEPITLAKILLKKFLPRLRKIEKIF